MSENRLPNFFIIGAARCGSTSLYEYLRAHPRVAMSSVKETDFFSVQRNWRRGTSWYARFFPDRPGVVAIGEASASYSRDPVTRGVPERIHALVPRARFVYLVRHPLERMLSHYLHRVSALKERAPVERALVENPIYVATSRYHHQI